MESIEAQLAEMKAVLQAQAVQISQLNMEVNALRAMAHWVRPETFDFFPRLPPELRNRIWEFAVPEARVITVKLGGEIGMMAGRRINRDQMLFGLHIHRKEGFQSHAYNNTPARHAIAFMKISENARPKTPALLLTCKESRKLVLKKFEFCFSTSLDESVVVTRTVKDQLQGPSHQVAVPHSELTSRGIRLQPSCDIIYLSDNGYMDMFLKSAEPQELKTDNILRLALDMERYEQLVWDTLLSGRISLFACLQELLFVIGGEFGEDVDACDLERIQDDVDEHIREHKQKRPELTLPVIKVMTEPGLNAYAKGLLNHRLASKWI